MTGEKEGGAWRREEGEWREEDIDERMERRKGQEEKE